MSHSLTWIHDWTEKQMNVCFLFIVGLQAAVVGTLDIYIVSLIFTFPKYFYKKNYFKNRILKNQRMEQTWVRDHSLAISSIRESKRIVFSFFININIIIIIIIIRIFIIYKDRKQLFSSSQSMIKKDGK